ncbi:DUF4810 domain-containing protein [Diaphorobacter ruginosibacter]|uniref:DUF4810 domain-containing protein n=1 Tax=Diaphorobacter ruginosibacter TaxID=1715720 RepID=UPI00333F1CA1
MFTLPDRFPRAGMRWLAAAAALAALTGCASNQGLYQWGGYDAALYSSYKNPETVTELQTTLEQHIASMNASQQKVAPGLYAELGSLYLQQGRQDEAIEQYRKERELWPESRTLMDALITTLENRARNKGGDRPEATEEAV